MELDANVAVSLIAQDPQPTGSSHHENTTLFSTRGFIEAWSRSFGDDDKPLPIPVKGSGAPRTMYAIKTIDVYGLRSISLGPVGFYASPGWEGQLERFTLEEILDEIKGVRTRSFVWNVRFDHGSLAAGLSSLGLASQRTPTHVLNLKRDYEAVFGGYNATIRNQVRAAARRGVRVRTTQSFDDLRAYYKIHMSQVEHKGGYLFIFPMVFLTQLVDESTTCRFFVAEYEGRIIAGGIFLRDGCSVFYLHSAYDRHYSHLFPSCAVLDEAIRWACDSGAAFFNFGGSAGIASLEKFKASWRTTAELNWVFHWQNPLWARLSSIKAILRRNLTAYWPARNGHARSEI
jgi:hypothetical protein